MLCQVTMVKAWVTRVVVRQQVVVEGCIVATPDAAIAMTALVVHGVGKRLRQYASLHGEVLVAIE